MEKVKSSVTKKNILTPSVNGNRQKGSAGVGCLRDSHKNKFVDSDPILQSPGDL